MNAGQIIYQQLRATSFHEMMCWGATQFVAGEDGLRFKVSGLKFKGYVYVKYDVGSDTYTLQLGTIRKFEWKIKQEVSDIYCDELGTTIDELVEM